MNKSSDALLQLVMVLFDWIASVGLRFDSSALEL